MSKKAWLRTLNNEPVVFAEFKGDSDVVVSVGGARRTMTIAAWQALPLYQGPVPFSRN